MGTVISLLTPSVPTSCDPQVADYIRAAVSSATRRAYRADWADFGNWCDARGLATLPATAGTTCSYLADCAGRLKVSTVERRAAAIARAHEASGLPAPTAELAVRKVLAGIRRTHRMAPDHRLPLSTEQLRAMISTLPETDLGKRDRAVLLAGFAGAFRRGELVGLDVGDLVFTHEGVIITLKKSKTDQEGRGRRLAICRGANPTTCPVAALETWLTLVGPTGPLFRPFGLTALAPRTVRLSDKAVARIVKRACKSAGIDPRQYAGHSLRAGFATSAAKAGASERAIMNQTGHRSLVTVRRYIRDGSLFHQNASGTVGL
jgi:integrase